jgi:hypothetical protein
MTETGIINALATARYTSWAPWMGTPIATSIGKPKWMPGIEQLRPAVPFGVFGEYDTEFAYRVAYEALLDKGSAALHRELVRLSAKYPGERLVLLCWCDITKAGNFCHRRMLADWLATKDVEAPELTLNDRGPTVYEDAPGPGGPAHVRELLAEPQPLFGEDFR